MGKTVFEPDMSNAEDTLSSKGSNDDYDETSDEKEEKEPKKKGGVRFGNEKQDEGGKLTMFKMRWKKSRRNFPLWTRQHQRWKWQRA